MSYYQMAHIAGAVYSAGKVRTAEVYLPLAACV